MRKIYLAFLCIATVFICCSCLNKDNEYVKSSKTYGYYSAFDVSFGMPKDEVIKELNLKETDIVWIDKSELSDDGFDTNAFSVDLKFHGVDSTVVFFFMGDLINDSEQAGLTRYRINFKKNVAAQEVMDKLQQDFDDRGLEYEYNYFGGQIILYSNLKSIDDIEDPLIREKALVEVKEATGDLYEEKSFGKTAEQVTFDQIMLQPPDGVNLDESIPPEKREVEAIDFISKTAAMVGRAANSSK